jgi:membrane peptidoglycan carboxypeptidase
MNLNCTEDSISFQGYVVYSNQGNKYLPFGVVSNTFECQAYQNFIPSILKRFLIQIEDKRFFSHPGIDLIGIIRAIIANIKAGKIVQGGSSITQQLARNLLKDTKRTIGRKIRETIIALELEIKYPKEEILNLYFNNVYFGKNLRGLRTASIHYFEKEVELLNQKEQLLLLTLLRGPNYYLKNPDQFKLRYNILNQKLYDKNLISKNRYAKNKNPNQDLKNNSLEIINNRVIPFITKSTISKTKTIISTIDNNIQKNVKRFVSDSKYPASIIAIRNNDVVAFASSYGSEYPFLTKSNVGSTLKPFIYCYLREEGLNQTEMFNSQSNKLDWQVREARQVMPFLNLEEALYHSNNNAFINACDKAGFGKVLQSLSSLLNQDPNDLTHSSILGATKWGISLHELALIYFNFFHFAKLTPIKNDCLSILNKIATEKLGFFVDNIFLKTGTTNKNKERYAILGNPEITYAVLRNENPINDESKEGGFLNYLALKFSTLFNAKNNYKWS